MVVPEHLKGESHLVLQYGTDLHIPIPDLIVDDYGVSATLSFARTPHRTVVPWSAVYVVVSDEGRGVLYDEDVPRDVAVIAGETDGEDGPRRELEVNGGGAGAGAGSYSPSVQGDRGPGPGAAALAEALAAGHPARRPPARALQAVPLGAAQTHADSFNVLNGAAGGLPPRRRRRPQLRLVK